jgi:hypothetical protein
MPDSKKTPVSILTVDEFSRCNTSHHRGTKDKGLPYRLYDDVEKSSEKDLTNKILSKGVLYDSKGKNYLFTSYDDIGILQDSGLTLIARKAHGQINIGNIHHATIKIGTDAIRVIELGVFNEYFLAGNNDSSLFKFTFYNYKIAISNKSFIETYSAFLFISAGNTDLDGITGETDKSGTGQNLTTYGGPLVDAKIHQYAALPRLMFTDPRFAVRGADITVARKDNLTSISPALDNSGKKLGEYSAATIGTAFQKSGAMTGNVGFSDKYSITTLVFRGTTSDSTMTRKDKKGNTMGSLPTIYSDTNTQSKFLTMEKAVQITRFKEF